MSVHEPITGENVASEHSVRFFDTDESRVASVGAFFAEGYERDCPLIAVLRPRVWADVRTSLEGRGVPIESLIASRELLVLDADDTLERLSGRDGPHPLKFDKVIGVAVREFGRPVYACGEMVDILAQRMELPQALELEAFWNGLARQVPLILMCGYCSAHFVSPTTQRALAEICRAHTRVDMKSQDQLGNWLLTGAGLLPASAR
ncbi:MAG TPA: MEDS domain-containing protein [Vicinamibacterales bacterium]